TARANRHKGEARASTPAGLTIGYLPAGLQGPARRTSAEVRVDQGTPVVAERLGPLLEGHLATRQDIDPVAHAQRKVDSLLDDQDRPPFFAQALQRLGNLADRDR